MTPVQNEDTRNLPPGWLSIVREKVESLRFGVVQIVVHDAKVTLIERTEKTRIDPHSPGIRSAANRNLFRQNTGNEIPNRPELPEALNHQGQQEQS